jgi:hypothetical protein
MPDHRGAWLTDLGINDDFMKQAARTLRSGNAALFLLICKMTTGTVLRSSVDETKGEANALSLLVGEVLLLAQSLPDLSFAGNATRSNLWRWTAPALGRRSALRTPHPPGS